MQVRIVLWVLITVMISCRSQPEDTYLLHQLQARVHFNNYELVQINYSDTLLLSDFKSALTLAIADWQQNYTDRFNQDFQLAYDFFSQAHVKHLHDQRLAIEDVRDSISLIYEHANSFVNEQSISGQYLDELATLNATLDELKSATNEIVYFTISHKYSDKNQNQTFLEKLFYFPNDSIFMAYDPALNPVSTYTLHKFVQNLPN